MTSDPGLASSSEQKSRGHNLSCESRQEHEVFLSHSRKEKKFVRNLFDDFLSYERFRLNKPFFDVDDDSLRKEKVWIPKLIKAARECKVAVLILTQDYMTSKWPLLELLHFVDARKTINPGIILLPVFFGDRMVRAHLYDANFVGRWKAKWEKLITHTSSSAKLSQVPLTMESCLEALEVLKGFNHINDATEMSYESLRKSIFSRVVSYLPSSYEMDPKLPVQKADSIEV